MQNIKLIIPGSYYDSQIYAGRLYLWTLNGSIITIDWDKFVYNFSNQLPERLRFAAHCAFKKSGYLYGDEWKLFIQDTEMKTALLRRFDELSMGKFGFNQNDFDEFIIQEQDNPFPFPHADTLFYYGQLYSCSRSGIKFTGRGRDRNPLMPNARKVWDGPVLSVAAKHETLALSAGSEGLYEFDIPTKERARDKVKHISSRHSNGVRWLYASLYSSSYQGGYLADYDTETMKEDDKTRKERRFLNITSSNELFSSNETLNYSWGAHDKLCLISNQEIMVLQYTPNNRDKPRFSSLGSVDIKDRLRGDIVHGDSALFGYIIETDDGLLIIDSGMEYLWIEGEPVNWRVFPDSTDYTNHLHVIYEDYMEIHSFFRDYFVDQETKTVGIKRSSG